ncbi:hypothetical protein, partial [Pseudomonas lurida]|uniref:hypothetical protein n=1 Tax=Pseudomonas lurida TaxID=244566 RepID=UPI0034D97FE6
NLVAIKDWAKLKNNHILTLEGHDLRAGWHSYLWHDRRKIEKSFTNHYIRAALIKTWEKYKTRFFRHTPLWISPVEAKHKKELGTENWLTYH